MHILHSSLSPFQYTLRFVLITAVMGAATVCAKVLDSHEQLQADLHFFESTLNSDSADEQQQRAEIAWEQQNDVIRAAGTGAVRETDGTGAFVAFRIGKKEIILHDVPRSAWFGPYVRDAAERGIVSGYRDPSGDFTGEFKPANNVTIEELSKIAFVASAGDLSSCPKPTNSGALKSWSSPYIGCAEKNGWVLYADGSVLITRPALRSEVIVTILQAFKVPLRELSGSGTTFTDVSASTQFASAIETAARAGLVSGYSDVRGTPTGLFGPGDPVKRAEIAKIISLALQLYAK